MPSRVFKGVKVIRVKSLTAAFLGYGHFHPHLSDNLDRRYRKLPKYGAYITWTKDCLHLLIEEVYA